MNTLKKNLVTALVVAGLMAPAAAYSMPWSWDMFDQSSHKAQEEPYPAIPEGSVPTNADPAITDRDAAVKLKNPIPRTAASIKRGKERYETFCLTCHGATGVGDGPVGLKYIAPADLSDEYVQSKPDGDIFYTIKYGGLAIMPSHGDLVSPADRWHIINYIKSSMGRKPAAEGRK